MTDTPAVTSSVSQRFSDLGAHRLASFQDAGRFQEGQASPSLPDQRSTGVHGRRSRRDGQRLDLLLWVWGHYRHGDRDVSYLGAASPREIRFCACDLRLFQVCLPEASSQRHPATSRARSKSVADTLVYRLWTIHSLSANADSLTTHPSADAAAAHRALRHVVPVCGRDRTERNQSPLTDGPCRMVPNLLGVEGCGGILHQER